MWASSDLVLGGFEDLAGLVQLLQLATRHFEFIFFLGDVVTQSVNLVEDHFHRALFLPRFACFLT